MAIPVWPEELPQRVLRAGYSETFRDGLLRSRSDSGVGKVRRRYSSAALPVAATISLFFSQKARLERFWYEETGNGALPFTMPDQTHDGLPMLDGGGLPILNGSGLPVLVTSTWLVQFAAPPQIAPRGPIFSASLQLNVLP
jgi:hypothetical protein